VAAARQRAPILVVDDNDQTRGLLQRLLELEGYATVAAADGVQALQYLRAGNRVAVVITDIRMPVMDGRSLTERMRADPALADVPVIVYSAAGDLAVPGVTAFVRKSAHPDVLLALVAKYSKPE
jgi:CheY-like chemotaxis protein